MRPNSRYPSAIGRVFCHVDKKDGIIRMRLSELGDKQQLLFIQLAIGDAVQENGRRVLDERLKDGL